MSPNHPLAGLVLATQFLTRLPTPQVNPFSPALLARSARWFPVVGSLVGGVVALAWWCGAQVDPWLAGFLAVLAWVAVTGGLHLDGLADLADALGAAHRDPTRFLQVLKDPHVGSFGVLVLVLQVLGKTILLMLLVKHGLAAVPSIILSAMWARWATLVWSRSLPALGAGLVEQFKWSTSAYGVGAWGLMLLGISLGLAPVCALAPLWIGLWHVFLQRRVGGVTGDCLGAGVELLESSILLSTVFVL